MRIRLGCPGSMTRRVMDGRKQVGRGIRRSAGESSLIRPCVCGRPYALVYVGRLAMVFPRTACISFCIVITSAIANGQWQSDTTGDLAPQRRLHTRSESGGRRVVVETVEGRNIEGRVGPLGEVVTETTEARDTTHTRQDLFRVTVDGRRRLEEANESRQETRSNGTTSAVHRSWVPDLNGRLRLTSQLLEETRSLAPDVRRTDTTLLLPGLNEPLREIEQIGRAHV